MKKINFSIIILCFFFVLSGLSAYQSSPLSLFDSISAKSFEKLKDGTDSYVQKIDGVELFNQKVVKSPKGVVVKFFSDRSQALNNKKNDYQNLAEYFKSDVKFVSVNVPKNVDLLQQIMKSFLAIISDQELEKNNPKLHKYLVGLFQYMIIAQKDDSKMVPFLLFFKGSNMIIPKRFNFSNKQALLNDVKTQLLDDGLILKEVKPDGEEKNGVKKSFWNKVKNSGKNVKKWFVGDGE